MLKHERTGLYLATYRVKAGWEEAFISSWNELAEMRIEEFREFLCSGVDEGRFVIQIDVSCSLYDK